jgi:molybdopterin synthase catalytic subunit
MLGPVCDRAPGTRGRHGLESALCGRFRREQQAREVSEYRITTEAISLDGVVAGLGGRAIGAVATFVGVVRGKTGGRRVDHLEYEAYSDMAEETLRQIGAEIRERWPSIQGVSIVHRTGRLEVGETAVVIAVSAAHRVDVFDALRYAIDRLKEVAPIWKREVGEGGAQWRSEG